MSKRTGSALLSALIVLAACVGSAGSGLHPGSSLPFGLVAGDIEISPFYRWPGTLPTSAGRLLREEAMPAALVPPHAAVAKRLLYTSTDGRWNSGILPVSGALFLPQGEAPRSGWPLVVWAHGTLGVSDACAPSWAGSNQRDRAYVDRWLEKGYAVVAPDYQGLGGPGPHPYTLAKAEALSVLDAARVALAMDRRIANRVAITGQSQGSGAALGAANLAARYAPDVKVIGVIATALLPIYPESANLAPYETGGDSPHFLVYRLMSGSLPDGSPPAETFLTDKGRILLDAARTGCKPRVVAEANGITMDNAFAAPVTEIEALVGLAGATNPFRSKFPLLLGTGLADELILASRQARSVAALCRAGNRVVWKRYPDTNHSNTLTRSFEDAEAFARAVLAGRPDESDCASL